MFSRFHAAWNYFYSVSLSLSCISFVSRVENSDFIQNVYQVWEINCWKLKQLNRIKRRQFDRKACAVYVWIFRFWFNFVFSWPVAFVLSVELIKNQFGLLLNSIWRYNNRRDIRIWRHFGFCAQTEPFGFSASKIRRNYSKFEKCYRWILRSREERKVRKKIIFCGVHDVCSWKGTHEWKRWINKRILGWIICDSWNLTFSVVTSQRPEPGSAKSLPNPGVMNTRRQNIESGLIPGIMRLN